MLISREYVKAHAREIRNSRFDRIKKCMVENIFKRCHSFRNAVASRFGNRFRLLKAQRTRGKPNTDTGSKTSSTTITGVPILVGNPVLLRSTNFKTVQAIVLQELLFDLRPYTMLG